MEVQTMNKVSKVFILRLEQTVVGVFATEQAAMDWVLAKELGSDSYREVFPPRAAYFFNHTICSYPLKY